MVNSHSFLTFKNEKYFQGLDGLRAIAILLVFTAHPRDQAWLGKIHGPVGVTLFFVISGFLITHLLIKEEEKFGRINFKSFYLRRLFRIYPLYFTVLIIYIVLIIFCGFLPDRKDIFIENIPLLVSPFPELTWFFHTEANSVPFNGSWSIGIEEKFYIFWPFIGFFLMKGKFGPRLAFLVFSFFVFTLCSIQQNIFLIFSPYAPIVIGASIAILLNHERSFLFLQKMSHLNVRILLLLITLGLTISTEKVLIGGSLYSLESFLIGMNFMLYIVSSNTWLLFLRARFLVYLGKISYSFYLTHNFAINFVELVIPKRDSGLFELLVAFVGLVISILVAGIFTKFLEVPATKFGRRLSGSR